MNSAPTIFVIDDEPAIHGWISAIARSIGLEMESFYSGDAFLSAVEESRAGCVVSDIRMPGMQGLEIQKRLKGAGIALPVIFLSGQSDIGTAVEAMREGAHDFLEKPVRDQVLIERIHAALEEDRRRRETETSTHSIRRRMSHMTEKEREVLECILGGMANKAIASELGVSEKTVEYRRARLMRKAGVQSSALLIRMALACESKGNPGKSPTALGKT